MISARMLCVVSLFMFLLGNEGFAGAQDIGQRFALIAMVTVTPAVGAKRHGAGILLSQDISPRSGTVIVTAFHVVPDPNATIEVQLYPPTTPIFRARRAFGDKDRDLAILVVDDPAVPHVLTPELAASVSGAAPASLVGGKGVMVGFRANTPWAHEQYPEPFGPLTSEGWISILSNFSMDGLSGGGMFEAGTMSLVGMTVNDAEMTAAAIPIGTLLQEVDTLWQVKTQLRFDSHAAQLAAQQRLAELGYPANAAGLAQALATGDESALKLFTAERLSSQLASQALRMRTPAGDATAAQRYFEALARTPGALDWLREALTRNGDAMDPNLRITNTQNDDEAIINVAARASSVNGVIALLDAGASPNGYQNIQDWGLGDPRFLIPLEPVLSDANLDRAAQERLVNAYLAHGVVIPHMPPTVTDGGVTYGPIVYDFVNLQSKRRMLLGAPFAETANLCESFPQAACQKASQLYHVDWCDVVRRVPRVFGQFSVQSRDNAVVPPFIVRYFLGADGHAAYFLAEMLDYYSGYGVLEVDHDLRAPHFTRFTNIQPYGAAGCRGNDGSRYCWRRFDLTFDASTGTYHSDYESHIAVSPSCDVAAQQSKARADSIVPRPVTDPNPKVAECVNEILKTPVLKLSDEASHFDIFSKLTLRPRDCVLAKLNALLISSPDGILKPGLPAALATECCRANNPTPAPAGH